MFKLIVKGIFLNMISSQEIENRFQKCESRQKKALIQYYLSNSEISTKEIPAENIHQKIDEYREKGILKAVMFELDYSVHTFNFHRFWNEVELTASVS